ncbi:hypothetical protein [Pseudooceanicola algae]|uniref:hypothetical protein n=1 Tax=Pseudooceanicola algae TaxID=1537215 RepID=UPI0011C49966|nr:hypothetical protein [Pseudooceanicola algae]
MIRIFNSDNFGPQVIEILTNVGEELRQKRITPSEAARQVSKVDPVAGNEVSRWGELLKEYGVPVGTLLTGLGTLLAAVVAALAFGYTHIESRSNLPPYEGMDYEFSRTIEAAGMNGSVSESLAPQYSIRPPQTTQSKQSEVEQEKKRMTPSAKSKPPRENRHSRRARLAKERSNSRKN